MYKEKIEVLAPAGNFACLFAAIEAGADSIYFGIDKLNMRSHGANNFSIEDLFEISKKAKQNNIKTYLTLNTVLYDNDLAEAKKIIDAAKKAKIDAIIASDFAAISYANKVKMKVHISTQANVSNIEAIKFFANYADTIVLARELSLEQIKNIINEIKKQNIIGPSNELIKIEIFIHGALCVAISGKCYMSLAQYNMSANRGSCLQSCRRKYRIIEEDTNKELIIDNKYVMSPKDLCTISCLKEILNSGVSILKIEGRARPPEYVYETTKCYKKALKQIKEDKYTKENIALLEKDLKKVFNRGFWHGGYYLNSEIDTWSGIYGSKASQKKIYVGKVTNYFSKIKVAEVLIQSGSLSLEDSIYIIGNKTGIVEEKIAELKNENRQDILSASKGDIITLPIDKKVKVNDKLYIIQKVES